MQKQQKRPAGVTSSSHFIRVFFTIFRMSSAYFCILANLNCYNFSYTDCIDFKLY